MRSLKPLWFNAHGHALRHGKEELRIARALQNSRQVHNKDA